MKNLKAKLITLLAFLRRENLLRLLMIILALLLLSTIGVAWLEPDISLVNAFWWSIVTLTTVGYGDITPQTVPGRFIGVILMLLGIGILGMFTATIASIFVEKKLRADRGMQQATFERHIILCEWNHRAREILREFRADPRLQHHPIVLIADLDNKPVDDENLHFIQGGVTEENLQRANIDQAETVVVLGDDRLEPNARDAKVVLSALTIESLNRNVYTITELVDENNVRHCERAHADEIIVSNEFSSRLISRAAMDHGISKVLSELLSSKYGNDLMKIAVPEQLAGRSFIEAFLELKREHNRTVVALLRAENGQVLTNPPSATRIELGDHLIVIAES